MELKDKIFFTLVAFCIIALVFLIIYMKDETTQCMKNPYIYGAENMKNVECSCYQFNNPLCPAQFSFNGSEFRNPPTICGNQQKGLTTSIDWGSLNFTG